MKPRPRLGERVRPPAKTAGGKSGRAPSLPFAKKGAALEADEGKGPELPSPDGQRMKLPEILAELEEACKTLGIRVTYEAIGGELGAGGLCKVKGQWRAIIDKRATPSERVQVLGPVVARFFAPEESPVAVSPPVRELLLRLRPGPGSPFAESAAPEQLAG